MRVALVVLALLAAAPAQAGVRVVAPFDPEDYADRAAVGLLVPGAGPTVTREAALAALLRGKLEHGLLGGIAAGENRIELGEPGAPEILVSLPPPGRSDNDVRYPIALLGERGLLTSDSTRIDGLVSVTDVATGRLRVVANDDPAQALEQLDDRIEWNSDWRLPLTIALAALLIVLAIVRPRYALRALLVALAANLWLSPLLAVTAGVAVLLLPLGWACAAILLAYLVSMGLDPETVALSPFGPSQSGRFYGINNLLETMLLAPALLGAALLGRAGFLVAGLAFVTIGGTRFGADGGGIVVLAVAYLVLWLRLRGERPSWRLQGWSQRVGSRSRCCCSASMQRPVARATSPMRSATARSRSQATSPTGSSSLSGGPPRASAPRWSCSARSRFWSPSRCGRDEAPCSTRSSSGSPCRSLSTTLPATCSAWAPRSRSRLLVTHPCTAG